jgi:hypothetical protein
LKNPTLCKPSWITTAEAARRAEVTDVCIGQWVRRYGIGRKVGGRLRIDPKALDRFLAGEPVARAS